MMFFKLTLLRNPNRPRLAKLAPYTEVVTFIRADNLKHADDIARDIVREHKFEDRVVEKFEPEEFKEELLKFINA